jgi:hypothetical protein
MAVNTTINERECFQTRRTYIYLYTHTVYVSRDSAVGIATGYGLDDQEVESR